MVLISAMIFIEWGAGGTSELCTICTGSLSLVVVWGFSVASAAFSFKASAPVLYCALLA